MLLVCNGAPKSGSTWLYNILINLVDCREPDRKFLTVNGKNPCIIPEKLESFIQAVDIDAANYITKNHMARTEHRDMLLRHDQVFVFDIERDPRDVIVSSWYDACNRHGYSGSFSTYYWSKGRELVAELSAYHALWRDVSPRFYVCSYEGLKIDFPGEVRAIGRVLGLSLSDDDVDRLRQATTMNKLREKYSGHSLYEGNKFFRKGVVGDWENYFDEKSLRDLEYIKQFGFGSFDRRHLVYQLKARVAWRFRK